MPILLHHAVARTIREAILPPGHAALLPGENGYNIDFSGRFNVHGATQNLTPEQVDALVLYIQSIE